MQNYKKKKLNIKRNCHNLMKKPINKYNNQKKKLKRNNNIIIKKFNNYLCFNIMK